MLNHYGGETIGERGAGAAAFPERTGLRVLAADLSPELDTYLNKLIDTAIKRTAKSDKYGSQLLSAFAAGNYSDAEFETVLRALDTSKDGATARSLLSAWLLGVPLLKEQHRSVAATALRFVLHARPRSLMMPASKRMIRTLRWVGGIAAAITTVAWIVNDVLSVPVEAVGYGLAGAVMCLVLYPLVLLCLRLRELDDADDLRFVAAHALGRLRAVIAVDALSAACADGNDYLSRMAGASLHVVLPDLTPELYGQLGSETVPNLCRLVRQCGPHPLGINQPEGANYSFTVELLAALEKIGDPGAIAKVRQASRYWPHGPVLAAANRTLAVLEERQRRETERATLLRGTVSPVIGEGELLRAVATSADTKQEELLRATE